MPKNIAIIITAAMLALTFLPSGVALAEPVDRIIASVNDTAITMRELEKKRLEFLQSGIRISRARTLDIMIDRLLMLREAKKLRFESVDEDGLIQEYVNLKIKAFISIRERAIRDYYDTHKEEFSGAEFKDVRDEIRNTLVDRAANAKLRRHLDDLRKGADVRIYLQGED